MAQVVSRLALLMQVLGLSGYDVANALNIDPSLISKWRRNRRRVPGRNDTMNKIAGYLLNIDDSQGGQNIRPMLENLCGGKPITQTQAVELLAQWLLDPDPTAWYVDLGDSSQVNLPSSSYSCSLEAFRGIAGRHSAVLRFLEMIRPLPAEHTLLMLMQDDDVWAESPPEFQLQFKSGMIGWLASGHKLETIQWVDQSPGRLQTLIHHWLPLHLDFQINAWYHPVYGDCVQPMTLYVVPGKAALVARRSGTGPDDYHTLLYTDQATVRQFEYLFTSGRAACLPLVENFKLDRINDLIARFNESWHQIRKRSICLISMTPLMISLPAEMLNAICEENNVPASSRDSILEQWETFRSSRKAGSRLRIVLHLGAIEQLAEEPDFIDPFLSAVLGQPVRVRQVYFRAYLGILGREISNLDRLEVALIRSEFFNRSAWPNMMLVANAFVTAWGSKLFQNRIFSQEASLVHAYEHYFEERWQQIPTVSRDRRIVAAMLAELAGDQPK